MLYVLLMVVIVAGSSCPNSGRERERGEHPTAKRGAYGVRLEGWESYSVVKVENVCSNTKDFNTDLLICQAFFGTNFLLCEDDIISNRTKHITN